MNTADDTKNPDSNPRHPRLKVIRDPEHAVVRAQEGFRRSGKHFAFLPRAREFVLAKNVNLLPHLELRAARRLPT